MDNIQQPQGEEERRRQEEAWTAHLAYIAHLYSSPARGRGRSDNQCYEHNGWLYGAADRPGYSDTPKDKK